MISGINSIKKFKQFGAINSTELNIKEEKK